MTFFFAVLDTLFFGYLTYISVYNLALSLGGLKKRLISEDYQLIKKNKILVLIPCYKDHLVITDTAIHAIKQDYPDSKYHIVVIADTVPRDTIRELKQLPIQVLEVSFEQSTKVKALNRALDSVTGDFDCLVILDADNLMGTDFLKKFNTQFNRGSKIIQGQRLPKQSSSDVALLDGISEKINNHIFRKGSNNLGLSSSIAGSGFGGDFILLKEVLINMDSVGGFDKELEILLLKKGYKTEYFENLLVYEEKVKSSVVFKKQRKRWISSQYFYLRKYFISGLIALFNGRLIYFNSSILRNLQLPRLLNLGILPLFLLYLFIFNRNPVVAAQWWIYLSFAYILSIIIALPREFYSMRGLRAVAKVPGLFFIMFKLLFRLNGANTKFIHTPHGVEDAAK